MYEAYDVILTGIDSAVADRAETINNIAALLEMESEELKYLIDNNPSIVVKKGIRLDDAQNYQHHIHRRGGYCNYRPTRGKGVELELEPQLMGNDIAGAILTGTVGVTANKASSLKKEIQQQSVLPKMLNSRFRLYALVGLCWMVGAGMGATAVALYRGGFSTGLNCLPAPSESEPASATLAPPRRQPRKKPAPDVVAP